MPPDDDTTQHQWSGVKSADCEWICKRCGMKATSPNEPDSRKKFILMEMVQPGKFATNPQVKEYLAQRAERPESYPAVLRKMWERDEQGWRTAALNRCREMGAVIQAASHERAFVLRCRLAFALPAAEHAEVVYVHSVVTVVVHTLGRRVTWCRQQ